MTKFERHLNILFGNLALRENDPGFRYCLFELKDEEQARIYRLPNNEAKKLIEDKQVPMKGMFVSAAMHPELKQLCLAYSSYPKDSDKSIIHGMLAYDDRELMKGVTHITTYFAKCKVPEADGEFDKAA